jgi:hypothetical protein
MEPEGSLPCSQGPATCPYPEPNESQSTSPNPVSQRSSLMLSSHLRLGLPSGLLPSGHSLICLTVHLYFFGRLRWRCARSISYIVMSTSGARGGRPTCPALTALLSHLHENTERGTDTKRFPPSVQENTVIVSNIRPRPIPFPSFTFIIH